MTTASIQDARGVHQGLLISLGGLYAALPIIVVLLVLTRESSVLVLWLIAIGALYLPLPMVAMSWICAVRAQLGLRQPLKSIRRPQAVLRAAGAAGVVQVAVVYAALCWIVWTGTGARVIADGGWLPAVLLTTVFVGFTAWSASSLVRTLRWAKSCATPIAA